MSDDLSVSLNTLRDVALHLNNLTDQVNAAVKRVEDILIEWRIGTDVFVRVKETPGHGKLLGYIKVGSRHRIVVAYGDIAIVAYGKTATIDPQTITPWSDCARDTKLETIKKLPNLINAISNKLEEGIGEAEKANESLTKIVQSLTGKEG